MQNGSTSRSREVAKRRLSQVLVHDRASVSPELMDALKWEMVNTAAAFINTNPSESTVHLELSPDASTIVVRIPVLGVNRTKAGNDENADI